MNTIIIKNKIETDTGWQFTISVSDTTDNITYFVDIDREYWQRITDGAILPEALIERSFAFLLQRESKESILKKFNLTVIAQYFPEYEAVIADM